MAVIGVRYDGCDHTYDDNGNRIELNPNLGRTKKKLSINFVN